MSVIETYTGERVDLLNPRVSQIRIEDIAHALSNICRFTGHVQRFYSVAEHCVMVSRNVPEQHALHALLHDASEAYVTDISSPLKKTDQLAGYRWIEARWQAAIFSRFGVPQVLPREIHEADTRMAATEALALFRPVPAWVWNNRPYYHFDIAGWNPNIAEEEYALRFIELGGSAQSYWEAAS